MRKMLGLGLLVALGICQLAAQQAATTDAPASKEDIEKLFTTMHIREQMKNMMELMSKQSKQMAHDALKQKLPDISQKDLDRMDAISDQALKNIDVNGMLDDMIPVYQRHLTKADVAAMAGFYETPTGQKVLHEQPEMTAEAMKAVQPRMQKMMANTMDEVEKLAKEIAAEPQPANSKH